MIEVSDINGELQEAYCKFSGGMVDAIVRADTRQDWLNAAVSRNLMDEVDNGEGNITLQPAPGVDIDEIGSVVITPTQIDEEGNIITEAVTDNRWHVNVRVSEPALSVLDDTGYFSWINTVVSWTEHGTTDTEINANENAKKLYSVSLIDPDTINTPKRVWL